MQRCIRRHGGLDDGSETHLRVEAAGLECRPACIGQRRIGGSRQVCRVVFRQQQPRRVHIAASYVRMNIDGPGHDDAARNIVGLAGRLALWRVDQHAIPYPDIAPAGAAIDRVDHLSSDEPGQHGKAFLPGKAPASCRTMFADAWQRRWRGGGKGPECSDPAGIGHAVMIDACLANGNGNGSA